nr:BTAD domain-containing putative transcriptional regulator [Mycobacterium sp. GA-1285]
MELGVLGPLQVRQYGLPVAIPGAKPRAILTMLGLHGGSVVSADALVELLWGDDPPRTATKALQTHISSLRRALGDGFVLTEGTGWTLNTTEIDAIHYKTAAKLGRKALTAGDPTRAVALFEQALALWRGIPELPDSARGSSEKTRWLEGHAALVEDRADALLATGRAAEIVGELESAIAEAPLRERRWGHLMLALYRAGRQGEALGAYKRARSLLAEELGVDPGPELRRLEAAIVAQDAALEVPQSQQLSTVTRAVTFLLTDIEGSTAAWEADAGAMAAALARHDELVEQVVTSRGGRLIKTRGEGDATFSVFDRPSAAAAAAIELQEAIRSEPWRLANPMRIRVALHTGEVEVRDGDYFGRAVNRAARLRSLATGGQILCSGATAELVIDSLPDDVVLADLGTRRLRNLPRPEHVFELRMEAVDDTGPPPTEAPMERPPLPAVLVGPGPFVGRSRELERLVSAWQSTLAAGTRAVLIAGEPGVGKTRLAGEWSRQAYEQGAIVLYGRCDEDLGAPYQPFAEALRSLAPCVDSSRLRNVRGIEALLPLIPGLAVALPDVPAPPRADPDTERYALFDAVVALLGTASATTPVVLILDDLHWAAKPTLLLLRHLLRFGEEARVQIIGTYRSTDLDRSHPLAAMLADLHRDGTATRLQLSGLDEGDVTAYVAEAGYDDEELGRALATVTGGNPFFLIEALRHVEESGGRWNPSTLPQGIREAVSRRLSRLTAETNKALAAAAVVGSRFALTLVEQVVGEDLVDAFDEAGKAGIVIEEPGGRYRFNHALVRQSLLAELPSVRRMRLHQRIAGTLETEAGADDELLAELAYHYFECAWAGNAAKAVEYCRRAAEQAMSRVAYEGAADLYDRALHALEELDDELPDRDELQAELLIAHCEALLAAGDVTSAKDAVRQVREGAASSGRLAAWGVCFDGELSILTDPERLDDIESAVSVAAEQLAGFDDAAGEAKAHTVRAGCLARLGRIGDCETALDQALTAARRARDHSRVNAVLAGAPLAALWGPNPVPRAGGRCLDVVRLLRITTGSPLVEATSTRCQAVLDAFRGRAAEGRRLIESARRTLTELGLRHALLEVDQFAGIIELVSDDAAAAEPYLRRAYEGFRRMGLDTDTADTAALLARACLALDRDAEADELCSVSERLAGHGSKASIAWRSVRAQLLARGRAHDRAKEVAEEAVSLAAGTDALVDHGDACTALATVLRLAGDTAGMRAVAEQAVALYERKGAAALAEKARRILGSHDAPKPSEVERPAVELTNACVEVGQRAVSAINRKSWDEFEGLFSPGTVVESRRRIVGFTLDDLQHGDWAHQNRRIFEASGNIRIAQTVIAVRGERLALSRLSVGSTDMSPGAPQDELLQIYGIDDSGRVSLQVWFDVDDMDAALVQLDALYNQQERLHTRSLLENSATRSDDRLIELFHERRLDEVGALFSDRTSHVDRRRGLQRESEGRAPAVENIRPIASFDATLTNSTLALRGQRLCLRHMTFEAEQAGSEPFRVEALEITEVDVDGLIIAKVDFDCDDVDAAFAELDARYANGEAKPYARTWSVVTHLTAAYNRHEYDATNCPSIDHRRVMRFAGGDLTTVTGATGDITPNLHTHIEIVHRLSDHGVVITNRSRGIGQDGFEAEWRVVNILLIDDDQLQRYELFDEEDVDAALARFDQLRHPATRLENAASRAHQRMQGYFANRDWDAAGNLMTEDIIVDDRRRVVNTEVRRGREATIASMQAGAGLGAKDIGSVVIATRADRLALLRTRYSGSDPGSEAFRLEDLTLVEIDADNRIKAGVIFDLDDREAAIAELDARYIAGEAAGHAQTWSVVAGIFASLARHEVPPSTQDFLSIDHRRGTPLAHTDLRTVVTNIWDVTPDLHSHIEKVHRLGDHGALCTQVSRGTTSEGFPAEWRMLNLTTIDGPLVSGLELFDETDLEAAIARFDELGRSERRLENAASRLYERFKVCFAAGDWDAITGMLSEDLSSDDRRRVVNTGLRKGREALVTELRALAEVGADSVTSEAIATRGERLVLSRVRSLQEHGGFRGDAVDILELGLDERVVARIVFDEDDIVAAFAELESRYLAGEASAHAHAWSVIAGAYAAVLRHELPPTAADWVNVDHRRVTSFAPNELEPFLKATWDVLNPDIRIYVETVHHLNDTGAVVTRVIQGTSREGFTAEWREIGVTTVEGDRINRSELFDEADLDAALARFEELSRPARRLENAASRTVQRICVAFADRDWEAMSHLVSDEIIADDRRPVVGSGALRGREINLSESRALAAIGATTMTSQAVAVRGDHLALCRVRYAGSDQLPEAFHAEALGVIGVNDESELVSRIVFEPEDLDAAVAELDARYAAGEARAYARTWSAIAGSFAAITKRQLPNVTSDWVNFDHRRGAVAAGPGDLLPRAQATWDDSPNFRAFIETVHRLKDTGAVVTYAASATSRHGFDAEWREVALSTVEGDLINRTEIFDETDLDAALARFNELISASTQLENAATRADDRFDACFGARDWDSMAFLLAEDTYTNDRRRGVNGGIREGLSAEIESMRTTAGLGVTDVKTVPIAVRGQRLALSRSRFLGRDRGPGGFYTDLLGIVEIDEDQRIAARVIFDTDDLDAAFAELDARYLAGEAALYARVWVGIADAYAMFNRHEVFPVSNWVTVDHRVRDTFAAENLDAYIRSGWDVTPDNKMYVECVHRLSDHGAVITHTAYGRSPDGFDAEWRMVALLTMDGSATNRCELFEEADLHNALAKFDGLSALARRPENAATRALTRAWVCFDARDWDAATEVLAEDFTSYDHRQVVNAGVRRGRAIHIENMQSVGDVGLRNAGSTVIATRGQRLALCQSRFAAGQLGDEVVAEALLIVETDAGNRLISNTVFDLDDIAIAFTDLDAKYAAGEAAAYARTWSAITRAYSALNRHEHFEWDWILIDHRQGTPFASATSTGSTHPEMWDVTPDLSAHIEVVHRLTDTAVLMTAVVDGTSQDGFEAEWRFLQLLTVTGHSIDRCELFDEDALDAAIARFDELSRPTRHLDNAATTTWARAVDAFNSRDKSGFLALVAPAGRVEDRRKGLSGTHSGVERIRAAQAVFGVPDGWRTAIKTVAIRGSRLSLIHQTYRDFADTERPITVELLTIVEVDDDDLVADIVNFDSDDIDAAFGELETRYLAGEAAAHARTWSAVAQAYTVFNRRELFKTTSDWVNVDHRRGGTAFAPGEQSAFIIATWEVVRKIHVYPEVIHRLDTLGAVFTQIVQATSQEGFDGEWREITLLTVSGDAISRCEVFDETDVDAALARFDELNRPTHGLTNTATQTRERLIDAFGHRDLDTFCRLLTPDGRYDDRRQGLRDSGSLREEFAPTMLSVAPAGWQWTHEPIAIRGHRLVLCRDWFRDTDAPGQPVAVDDLSLTEVTEDGFVCQSVIFDSDDLDGAMRELDARWIASGDVAHPEIIEAHRRNLDMTNRHEWDALTALCAGAGYINHRQLGSNTADYIESIRTLASLAPDLSIESADILAHSALGVVTHVVVRGTSTNGLAIEVPFVLINLWRGDHVTHIEAFDLEDRDRALARFAELNAAA